MHQEINIRPNASSYNKAYEFAKAAHEGQVRKYTGEPYIVHPEAVAKLVSSVSINQDEVTAALLHDVIEDCGVTFNDLLREGFSYEAARLVLELTQFSQDDDGIRRDRKALDRRYLARASRGAQTIKLADMIHNSGSISEFGEGFAPVYFKEMGQLLDVLLYGDNHLHMLATQIVDSYYQSRRQVG